MPDELDRLFELLVTGLSKDNRLAVPFPAAEVYERLVPYRSNRSHLNVATHQDYEMTVLRLLAGERGYLRLEPDDVREAMQREVTATSPDTAYFRNFPDCRVMINRLAAERFLRGDMRYAPAAPEPEEEEEEEPVSWTGENPVSPAPGEQPQDADEPTFELADDGEPPAAKRCPYCGGGLPAGRKVNFCPHCGQPPLGEQLKCPACGVEVDVGWAYCAGCGRATGFE